MSALVGEVVAHLATELHGATALTFGGRELDLSTPWRRASMVELIEEAIGVRLGVDQPIDEVRAVAPEHGVEVEESWGTGKLILEIYEQTTAHVLWGTTFVTSYPQEDSPLTRTHRQFPLVPERFDDTVPRPALSNPLSHKTKPN